MPRVGINSADNHVADTGRNDGFGARRCAAVGTARLQGNVKSRSGWTMIVTPSVPQRLDLGMRQSGASMPASADDLAILNQDGPDHRVGRGSSKAPPGQTQGQMHVLSMGPHLKPMGRNYAVQQISRLSPWVHGFSELNPQTRRGRTLLARMAADHRAVRPGR